MVDRWSRLWFWFLFLLPFELTLEQRFQPLTSPTERAALLQLRGSLGIRSKEWPRKPDPCLMWIGITCHNGSVVGINISHFRRTRIGRRNPKFVVDALANFTFLQSFNASNFMLPGSIPYWFGLRIPSLTVLDLRSCSITGSIPSTLGNLTNLTTLFLSDNNLTGLVPDSLGQLSALSVLDLSRNSLTGAIPPSLALLVNLSSLDMSANFLAGPIPAGIGALNKLQYLNLSDNGLTSLPSELGGLGSLVDLDLTKNLLRGGVPPDLRGLRSLQKMMLGNNMLDGTLPGNLFTTLLQLQSLVLRQNNFSGSLPVGLWSLPRLTFIDVSANNFSGLLPNSSASFGMNATAVMLNISDNMFYGGLTPLLRRFSFVDLSNNYFEGRVLNFVHKASLDSNCLQNTTNQRTTAECASFYAQRGLIFDNFGHPNAQKPAEATSSSKNSKTKIILAGVFGALGLIALLLLLVPLIMCRKSGNSSQRGNGVGPAPAGGSPSQTGVSVNFSNVGDSFTYHQLLQATGDFSDSNLIKQGHSGDLYNGILESGIPVIIKRIDMRSAKKDAYVLELDFFNKVSHQRFVPLLGHCLENENEKFLVYKYMPNGDLSNSLFYKKTTSDDGTLQSLDWITRLKIATGAAEALSYLHHECIPPFVHRDIQASSILLDDKYEVRLGSLSEVCVQEGDTHQSKISRFLRLPQSSEQSSSGRPSTSTCAYDVFCFGKVLLELVTGKLGISAASDGEVKEWLDQILPNIAMYEKELVTKIIDPSLVLDEDFLEEVWAIAIVARSCLNPRASRRPPMRYVLKALENPLKVVREENAGSARLRATSSRGSWNAALFGSWRQSSSDVTLIPATSGTKVEGPSSLKHSGTTGSQSQGSFHNVGDISSSRRRHSRDIFPEPSGSNDVERLEQE